jgi:hypothetical protein
MSRDFVRGGVPPLEAPFVGSRRLRRARRLGRSARRAFALTLLWAAACSSPSSPGEKTVPLPQPPGPGVIFSYPRDGQYDVPTGARILLTFSEALPASASGDACSKDGDQVVGSFCVEGPEGLIPGVPTVEGATLAFAPTNGFAAGATYRVYARPALLSGATNLPGQVPLLTFRTRSTRTRAGEAATVLTVNGAPLGADGSATSPFLDVAPVRLLFSEPLEPNTVTSKSVRLLHSSDSTPVDGTVLAKGIHLTIQPAQKLEPGEDYRLELTSAVLDRGGEPIAPVSLTFAPIRTAAPGQDLYPLSLNVDPAWSESTAQPTSRLGAMPVNSNVLTSQLVGTNILGVLSGGLQSLTGDTKAMGTTIPMIIPRGQRLDLTSMKIRHGGSIEAGVQTGTGHFTMLTDAVGFLMRNPFRSADLDPDDAQSPTYLVFTMDAVMSSEDPAGNTISTQTLLGVELLGLSIIDGDQLAVDQVGALDYDLLGIDTAPINLAMRLRTGSNAGIPDLEAPTLVSTFPANGAADIPPTTPVELNFSGPLDPALIRDGSEVTLTQGTTRVPTTARLEGTTLVITPARRLDDGASVDLSYSGLRSMSGAAVASGKVSFTTVALSSSNAAPPILVALLPGAPCALTGGSASSPGHCAGGQDGDTSYLPFTLAANRDVYAAFSQPMDPASLELGSECGKGSIRVESLGAGGKCSGVVVGSLSKGEREFRFTPNRPWVSGAAYRLTLVAGASHSCAAGAICGRNKLALNSDPIGGVAANAGGGPDVVIDFTGAPPTLDSFLPLVADPVADQNGNGYLDAGERPNDKNRVVMELTGFGGVITAASLAGDDCLPDRPGKQSCQYLSATMLSSVGSLLASCPVDAQGKPSTASNPPCIRVRVYPNIIVGTSTATDSTALLIVTNNNLQTGMMLERLRETSGPLYGYIMQEAGAAVYVIRQELYLDAPDLTIPSATHDQKSKPMSATLKGPITFRPDGRMQVALRNVEDVSLQTNIEVPVLGKGNIDMKIPAGEMRVTLVGPLPR